MPALTADARLQDLPEPDAIVVPGGFGTRALLHGEAILSRVRHARAHSTWTTSVRTGSLILGAAGGHPAGERRAGPGARVRARLTDSAA